MKSDNGPRNRRTVWDSFSDAFRGIGLCLRSERNMRIHLTACIYVLFFSAQMGLTRGEMASLVLAIGAVMCAEALNTSIEKLCDFAQKHQNHLIRVVKDVAAGGVLLCALAAALIGVIVMCRPELWNTLVAICTSPVSLILFLLSVAAALVFIFVGPERIWQAVRHPGKRPK